MRYEDKVARTIFAQLTTQNVCFAQGLCQDLPLAMGLEPYNAWHRKREMLNMSKQHADFMPPTHKKGKAEDALAAHVGKIASLADAKFFAGIVGVTEIPVEQREALLDSWDQALVDVGAGWKQVDFDIAGHLEINREMAEAA